jgi:hypothetical protein
MIHRILFWGFIIFVSLAQVAAIGFVIYWLGRLLWLLVLG